MHAENSESNIGNRGYFVLSFRIRIRRWIVFSAVLMAVVVYVAALFWTGYTMRMFSETSGPPRSYERQTVKYDCVGKLGKEYSVPRDFSSELRRSRIYRLDNTYVAHNGAGIVDDPVCLGASISDLMHKPGPVRYYIVDTNSRTVLLEIIKK